MLAHAHGVRSRPAPRSREASPRPRRSARPEPPSAAPRNALIAATAVPPLRRRPSLDPGTHPTAPAPVEAGLRAAGPQALLNIAADLLTHFSSWTAAQSFHPLLSPLVSRLSEKRGSRGREQPASPCQGHGPQQPLLPGKGRMPEGAAFPGNCGVAGSALCPWPSTTRPSWVRHIFLSSRGAPECCLPAQAQGWLPDQLSLLLWE